MAGGRAERPAPGRQPAARLYLRLLGYAARYKGTFTLAILSMLVLAATEPLLPWLLGIVLDEGFIAAEAWVRWFAPAFIVGLFLVKGVFNYASSVALHWVAQRVVMDLRSAMFSRLLALPASFYDNSASGELISKLTYDVSQVSQAATRVLMVVVKDSLTLVVLIGYMVYLQWQLAVTVLVLAPLMAYAVYTISRRLRAMSRRVQHSMGRITHVAQEAIEGQRPVKIFAGHDYEAGRFQAAINDARKYIMKVVMASASNVPVVQLILACGLAIATYAALQLSAMERLSAGEFVAFATTAVLLFAPAKRLTGINEHLQRGLAAAESVFGLLDQAPEPDRGTRELPRARGAIAFESVRFRYPGSAADAVAGVDLQIAAGTTVALVGASGGGKSTLVSLVPRLYEPDAGCIRLDGIDIRELSLAALRANIALVSQDVVLFNDTIRNNIAYGALRGADDAAVLEAARAAHVLEFTEALPDGLDTLIGDRGVRLSGGQRQRLAIARAILKDAPVLILDEATASLDSVSERHIQAAMENVRRNRTCLVIAHRLSTVESADRILVLAGGRVVEDGTHAQLLAAGARYAHLHRTQMSGAMRAAGAGG